MLLPLFISQERGESVRSAAIYPEAEPSALTLRSAICSTYTEARMPIVAANSAQPKTAYSSTTTSMHSTLRHSTGENSRLQVIINL